MRRRLLVLLVVAAAGGVSSCTTTSPMEPKADTAFCSASAPDTQRQFAPVNGCTAG